MNLDLRIPMGLMFLIVGGLLTVYGLVTMGSPIYEKSVGLNINLIWGMVMLVFGGVMLFLGRRGQSRPVKQVEGTTRPLGHGGH
jgi:hypothetical protein